VVTQKYQTGKVIGFLETIMVKKVSSLPWKEAKVAIKGADVSLSTGNLLNQPSQCAGLSKGKSPLRGERKKGGEHARAR